MMEHRGDVAEVIDAQKQGLRDMLVITEGQEDAWGLAMVYPQCRVWCAGQQTGPEAAGEAQGAV